jgi:hypothetical protein
MVETRRMRHGYLGVAPPEGMSFPSGKGLYHGMEPRYLTYVVAANLLYFVVGDPRIKVANDRGMAYSCSSFLVTEVTRPCVGRELVKFLGGPSKGLPMW